ncbi:MAG: hypothetical protein PVJ57_06755 [Phycisphaerae bacterium]|jgi:hypothetical protein
MNLAVTIPQLFYDIIARVLPGFLLLFVLDLGLRGTEFAINKAWSVQSDSSMAVLFGGFGYLAVCYFCGWLLGACRWPDIEGRIQRRHEPSDAPSLSTMYQHVRLQHAASGFRLAKLRAEARMLGAARIGLWLAAAAIAVVWALAISGVIQATPIGAAVWALRCALPLAASLAFLGAEPSAWHLYYGNIKSLYHLVIVEHYPK